MLRKMLSDYLDSELQYMKINYPDEWQQYRILTLTEKLANGYGQKRDREELLLLTKKGVK